MPEDRAPEQEPQRPRLRIRRGGELPQEFHSSREERLQRPDAPRKRESSAGFFRRNRRLLIIFANVVLLLVLVVLLKRPGAEAGGRARIGLYSLTLQGLRFGETVYATVTVKNTGRPGRRLEQPAGRISVRFALQPGSTGYLQTAALPREAGEEVVVGEAIPLAAALAEAQELRAEVSVASDTRSLRIIIKQ